MYEYKGAVHVHSIFSDGSGSIEDIIQAAHETELDFVILTDHNTLRAKDEGYEKWYDKTLLIVGAEINDKNNKNHYLALGIKSAFSTRQPAKEYVKKVKESGGVGFIAHPHEKRSSMEEHPPYPWTDWDIEEFDGIEIWNHMSEWMEGLTEQNKYNYFVHPLRSIVSPPKETLEVWDKLNLKRKVVGIGGVDAHAHKINLLGFFEVEVFPYKVLFKSIRTHILLDKKLSGQNADQHLGKDINSVINALGRGRSFISNYYYGDATGFRYFAESGGRIYHMGDYIPGNDDVRLRVLSPSDTGEIKLIYNGKEIESIIHSEAEFRIAKSGVYRIEVFSDGKAWIFTNHIRIGI